MAKRDSLLKMDYRPSSSVVRNGAATGGTSVSIDTALFLLRDGTQAMLANLDMGGFSISNVNLLDGVDLSTLSDNFVAHIANINAHHNKVHSIDGTDHTGTLSWSKVNKSGSNLTDIVTRTHSSLQGITANDHHNQVHAVVGSDHTVIGNSFDLIGLSATNTLAVLTPSANVSSGIERILKSSGAGNLNLASLTTILVNSTAELTLNPVGNLILDSQAGATIPGGSIQDDLGAYNRKWKTLFAAELYVETLVAQDVIATIGGRIMVAPTTSLIADVSNVANTIDVKHNNLQNGDFVVLQTAPSGVAQIESMRITSSATIVSGGYRYTVTRNLDGTGANAWVAGDAVVDITDGYIDLTSTSTMLNHFGPVIAIYDRTSVGSWNGLTPVAAMGNLRNFVDISTDTYGFALGNNLTLTPSTGFIGMTGDVSNGLRLFNTPLRMFNGATETVHIQGWNDIWIGTSTSDRRLQWNGSTLTIVGAVTIQAGSTGFTNITDRPTSLAGINATESAKLTGIATGATRNTIFRQSTTPTGQNGDIWYNTTTALLYRHNGTSWETVGNNYTNTNQLTDGAGLGAMADWGSINSRPARFNFEGSPSGQPAGLYLTATSMGYWNGSTFRTYMDNQGRFTFVGGTGAYVAWDGTRLFGGTSPTFSTSTANWYVDSTNGALVAGSGQVYITREAINLTWEGIYNTTTYGDRSKFRWYLDSSTNATLLAQMSLKESEFFVYAPTVDPILRERSLVIRSSNEVFNGLQLSTASGNRSMFFTSDGISYLLGGSRAGTLRIGSVVTDGLDVFGSALVNGNTIWHAGNDGAGSGLNADLLDGYQTSVSGSRWNVVPVVTSDGVLETGKYIDFHEISGDTSDFSYRLTSTSGVLNTSGHLVVGGLVSANYFQTPAGAPPSATAGYVKILLRNTDNALVAVMPSGNVRVLATN